MSSTSPEQVEPPSPSPNGRDGRGRFAPGNAGGPGNPHGRKVAGLRAALLDAVTPEDMAAIARTLVERARGGDIAAIREVLLRTIGRPLESDLLERLDSLEERLASAEGTE